MIVCAVLAASRGWGPLARRPCVMLGAALDAAARGERLSDYAPAPGVTGALALRC
jgi:hypothetical protein